MPETTPEGERGDFYLVDAARRGERAAERILTLVRDRIPQRFGLDAARDVQVLCPMNRGAAGAKALNLALQAALNPQRRRRGSSASAPTFAPGDKVMQIENDYDKEVYNGDLGRVASVDLERGVAGRRLRRPARSTYEAGELDRARARLRDDDPQGAGLRVPGGRRAAHDRALSDAAAPADLHRRSRAAAGSSWWSDRGRRWPSPSVRPTARRRWSKLAEWLAAPKPGTRVTPDRRTHDDGCESIHLATASMSRASCPRRRSGVLHSPSYKVMRGGR